MKRKRNDDQDEYVVKRPRSKKRTVKRRSIKQTRGTIQRAIPNSVLIDAYQKTQDTSIVPDIANIVKEKQELFAKQAVASERLVNQCRAGAMGPLTEKDGIACSYGITVPKQVAGLTGTEKIEVQDAVSFHPIFAFPIDGEIVNITAQVDGVIEQTIPRANILKGEGVLYRVIPVRSMISPRTRKRFNENEDYRRAISNFTIRLLQKLHPQQEWKQITDPLRHLDQLIAQTYVPLKVNGIPLVYWLGLFNDLRSARADVTASSISANDLETLVDIGDPRKQILGSFEVVEIDYDRRAQKLMEQLK